MPETTTGRGSHRNWRLLNSGSQTVRCWLGLVQRDFRWANILEGQQLVTITEVRSYLLGLIPLGRPQIRRSDEQPT